VPPRFVPTASVPDPLQAKVLWVDVPGYNHMKLVGGNELIPALLRRAEVALRTAGRPPQGRRSRRRRPGSPRVFEATSGDDGKDDAPAHHVVDNPLKSKLKDVPDLARMAALHDLVLRKASRAKRREGGPRGAQPVGREAQGNRRVRRGHRAGGARLPATLEPQPAGQGRHLSPDGRSGNRPFSRSIQALLDPSFGAAGRLPAAARLRWSKSTSRRRRSRVNTGSPPISAKRFSYAEGAAELSAPINSKNEEASRPARPSRQLPSL